MTGSDLAGTYELLICKRACSFAHRRDVFATAILVLYDSAIPQKEVDRIEPTYLYDPLKANACYAVKRNVEAQSYASASEVGVSSWRRSERTIQFLLFHSPDAGYSVELKRTGDLLIGTGRSWGVGMGAPPAE